MAKKVQEHKNPENVAVIYVRYSSKSQRDVSIDQQIKACQEYAARNGIAIVDIYDDHAMTGTNDHRPAFQKMLLDSDARAWSYVIVYAFDRFARDRYDSAVHKHTLKENGVRVVSVTEQVSDDPAGTLMESIFEGFAEYYSQELKRKIRRGQQYNAEHCIAGCRTSMPLGYDRSDDGHYAINKDEAQIVHEIFERVDSGESYVSIFDDLNNRGITTKKGAQWNKSSFNKMLTNDRYIGTYRWGEYVVENGIPAIIENDLFMRVQMRVNAKKTRGDGSMRRRQDGGIYALTGKLFCGKCGAPMIGVSCYNKHKKKFFYYACKNHREKKCDMETLPREKFEAWTMSMVKNCILTDDAIEWMAQNAVKNDTNRKACELELTRLNAKLSETEKTMANYIKAIGAGMYSETLKAEVEKLEVEREQIRSRIAYVEMKLKNVFDYEQIKAGLQLVRDDIRVDAPELCLSLIDNVIKSISYDGETLAIEVLWQRDDAHKVVNAPLSIEDIKTASYDTIECSYKAVDWRCGELIRTLRIVLLNNSALLVASKKVLFSGL